MRHRRVLDEHGDQLLAVWGQVRERFAQRGVALRHEQFVLRHPGLLVRDVLGIQRMSERTLSLRRTQDPPAFPLGRSGEPAGECGRVADLAKLTRSSASKSALDHHTQALAIARDISVPLEEARALEGIGRCHFQDGNPGQGGACLRQALTIYQHIGAPGAQRVQEALRERGL
jgi:hypothetical protein